MISFNEIKGLPFDEPTQAIYDYAANDVYCKVVINYQLSKTFIHLNDQIQNYKESYQIKDDDNWNEIADGLFRKFYKRVRGYNYGQ